MNSPILYTWEGDVMRPLRRFAKSCDKAFVVGEVYRLDVQEDRSSNSHRHYFAAISEAWHNLSESWADRFPTSEHLRKWLLVRAGYRDERTFVCGSKAEAVRFAAFVKPIDEFSVVQVVEKAVTVYTAKSQSTRAMGRKEFEESKRKVLDLLVSMLGIELAALSSQIKGSEAAQSRKTAA